MTKAKEKKQTRLRASGAEGVATTLASLTPDNRNANRGTERGSGFIEKSLRQYGAGRSVLADKNGKLIAGNKTVEAFGSIGLDKVRVIETDGTELIVVKRTDLDLDTDKAARELAIADNRAGQISLEWDVPQLESLAEDFGIDLKDVGFGDGELEALGGKEKAEVVEDELPTDVPTRCKVGELWKLGEHRLLCGDSTKAEDVKRLMDGAKAPLCFTSPPYGQQRDYTAESKDKVQEWDTLMLGVFANLPMADDGQVLVNLGLIHRDGEWLPYWDGWIQWMRDQGWRRFGWYVWDQGGGLPGDWQGRFAPSHEFVFHFNRDAIKPRKTVAKNPDSRPMGTNLRGSNGANGEPSSICHDKNKIRDSVIRINRNSAHGTGHPATFPVKFAADVLEAWLGLIYEPFCGAGSTLIAAEQLGRRCYGIEISPKYCDVIIARFEKFTGKQAEKLDG